MTAPLPYWADEWAPGITCCGKPAVRCQSACHPTVTVCSVTGWGIDVCAERTAELAPPTAHGLSDPTGVTDCCRRKPADLPGDRFRVVGAPGYVTCTGVGR